MFNIVLLDDNSAIRFSLKKILSGYFSNIGIDAKIYSSGDGVEGLGYVFITKPHVVIIDTTLPKYGGLEVLDYLKTNNQLTELNIPIIVIHENGDFDKYPNFKLISKHDIDFVDKLIEQLESLVVKQRNYEGDFSFKWNKTLAKQIIRFANNSDYALNKYASTNNIFAKLFGYFISYLNQVLASIFLAILYLFAGKEEHQENVEIKAKSGIQTRIKTIPGIAIALAGILFLVVQLVAVSGFALSLVSFRQESVSAALKTWDGGGTDGTCGGALGSGNWWSCGLNWSGDTAPVAGDDVRFDGTSTKNATIDLSFQGTMNNFTIASGYSGTITQARSITINGSYNQAQGTFTGGAFQFRVNGPNFTTNNASSTFTAPTQMFIDETFNLTPSATFNHNNGTIIFTGDTSGSFNVFCGSETLNLVDFTTPGAAVIRNVQSDCNLPLGNDPVIRQGFQLSGTISGTGTLTHTFTSNFFILNTGGSISGFNGLLSEAPFRVNGGTLNLSSYSSVQFNFDFFNSFDMQSGTFTAPAGTMRVEGDFVIGGGTFNHNNGTVHFERTAAGTSTLTCNGITFNSVNLAGSTGSFVVNSSCNLPIGNNPTINANLTVNGASGTLTGTGTLTTGANTTFILNSSSSLTGFTGLIANGGIQIASNLTMNLSAYSVLDLNGDFFVGNFTTLTMPPINVTISGDFITFSNFTDFVDVGTTFVFDSDDGGIISCNTAFMTTIVLSHSNEALTFQNGCALFLGDNPVSPASLILGLNTNMFGTGDFTVNGDLDTQTGYNFNGISSITTNGSFRMISGAVQDFSTYDFVDVNGDLEIDPGGGNTFVAPPIFNVAGNINITGGYSQPAGTLTLDGSNQTLSGNMEVPNLTKNVVSADTLYFDTSSIIRITGVMDLQGAAGNLLSLRSTDPGVHGSIYPTGTHIIGYLDVQDIANQNPVEIEAFGFNVTDSGNNFGWDFDGTNLNTVATDMYFITPWDLYLYNIDITDGTLNSTSNLTIDGYSVYGSNGLVYNPRTCVPYAMVQLDGQPGRFLTEINLADGVLTMIGDTGDRIASIAFDLEGNLWGVTGDGANVPETLYQISLIDGSTTFMATLGNGGTGEALGLNPVNGLLYHASGNVDNDDLILETIDPETLTITDIPLTVTYAGAGEITSLSFVAGEGRFIAGNYSGEALRVTTSGTIGTYVPLPDSYASKGFLSETCTPLLDPDEPSSVGPANLVNGGATTDTTPTFNFNLSDDNSGDNLRFQIQIDNNSDFSSPLVDYTSAAGAQGARTFTVGQAVGGGTYTVGSQGQTLPAGDYYWRVVAIDPLDFQSDYFVANNGSVAFTVQLIDDLAISVSKTEVETGETFNATVIALDPSQNPVTGYTGTVEFSSDSANAVLPSNYTFTGADAGEHTFTNQLSFTEEGFFTITITDSSDSNLTATSQTITVTEAESTGEENCAVNPNTTYCQQAVMISEIEINNDLDPGVVEICFETNIETVAFIEYGLASAGIYTDSTEVTTEYKKAYCITISGLDENEEYVFRINTTSQAGKSSTYQSTVSVGTDEPTEPPINPPQGCIEIDEGGISFNSQLQGIINYHTIAEGQCTLSYGITEELNEILAPTALGINHTGTIDLLKANGTSDIRYSITCNFEGQLFEMCTLPGVIPASQYRSFLPQPEQNGNIFEQLIVALREASDDIIPATLIGGSILAGALTIAADPRAVIYGFAWFRLRKKPTPWGVVYDSETSEPIPFVAVRIYRMENGEKIFVKEDISSTSGKYGFSAEPGKYLLETNHSDYKTFTKQVEIGQANSMIAEDLSLVRSTSSIAKIKQAIGQNLSRINLIIFIVGLILSVVAILFAFSPLNLIIGMIYLANTALLFSLQKKFESGYIFDSTSNKKVKGAFVRVLDAETKDQLDVQISDENGKYGFKLDPGDYLLNVYSNNYTLDEGSFSSDQLETLGDKLFIKANVDQNSQLDLKFPMKQKSLTTSSNPFAN